MFWWHEQRQVGDRIVDLAFTDSVGGVSEGGWSSLNLGAHVGDSLGAVQENRRRVAHALHRDPESLRFMAQVHGADVAVLPLDQAPTADAQITRSPDDTLVVLVADCTPVLLYDADTEWVAAVHAGRPGMTSGVVPNTVARLRELGARELHAVVGPSVCGRCYEVPAEMRDGAAAVQPVSSTVSWTGTPAIDVASGVMAQLAAAGVPADWVPGCTREEPRLFSHRRNHGAGRFAGLISWRRAA